MAVKKFLISTRRLHIRTLVVLKRPEENFPSAHTGRPEVT